MLRIKLFAFCWMESPSSTVMGAGAALVVHPAIRAYSDAYSANLMVTASSMGVSPKAAR